MPLPMTTKKELIDCLEKLSNLDQMPDLKEAIAKLKRTDYVIQENDQHKVIQLVVMINDKHQIENDRMSDGLVKLCIEIVNNADSEQRLKRNSKPTT